MPIRLPAWGAHSLFRPPVRDHQRCAGCGIWDADVVIREEPRRAVREAQGAPAVSDEYRSHAHSDHPRRPAELSDAEQQAGERAAGAERRDDRVGGPGELLRELEGGEEMAHHGARVRAAAGDPAPGAETAGAAPRAEQGERQRRARGSAHDQRGVRVARGGDGAARLGLGLGELGERSATGQGRSVYRGGEAVRRARAADGHEHAPRRHTREEQLEAAHLVAAAARRRTILALKPQRVQADGPREGRGGLEGRGPTSQTTGS